MTRTAVFFAAWVVLTHASLVPAQADPADKNTDPGAPSAEPSGTPPSFYVEPSDVATPVSDRAPPAAAGPGQHVEPAPSEPVAASPSAHLTRTPAAGPRPAHMVFPVYEPPPPPMPRHLAPWQSLWVGVRTGWFVPFGDLWGYCVNDAYGNCVQINATSWNQYSGSGPMLELDLGARLARHYNVFGLWERTSLGHGKGFDEAYGGQRTGDTDFWAVGVRVSSDPDELGLLVEFALGYRRARALWRNGIELRLTDAPLEARIGIGADIRLSKIVALSPMVTFGFGRFGSAQWVDSRHNSVEVLDALDAFGHGWLTLQLGAHFDALGKRRP
ncbi:MAG: hypothetical protein JW940_11905 [Polyangiaceae bacterium]|nr:hypothetical protein [Polyangiaceae bacterium]